MGAAEHSSEVDRDLNLRQVIDSVPALIHTARPDGYLDFFNRTWLDFVGQPLKSLLGWKWTSWIHPEDAESFVQKWRESLATGDRFEGAARVRRADGEYRWMLHHKLALRARDGRILKWHGSSIDIEDRKRTEEQLHRTAQELIKSEFYLAEAQRLGRIGNWVFDPAVGFDYWSRELFRMHGLDPAAGTPSSEKYLTLVHPQDREFIASLVKQMAHGVSEFDVTKRVVRPQGDVRYVRCVGAPVLRDGTMKRIGIGIDVTEHELLTQELRRREAYLAEAQKLSHTGSFGWRPGSEEHVWSEETYRIFEYDPGQKITLDMILERVHPEDRNFVLEAIERASTDGGAIDYEYRLLFPDDRVKYVHVLARPLENDSDDLEFAGAVIDMTEAKRAEEKTQLSERELRTIIEIMPAYMGTTLPNGTADFLSLSWLDFSGQTREEAMGWGWANVVHPDDVDRVLANWQAGLTSGKPVEQEFRCRGADGIYHWFLNRSLPLRDAAGKIVKWYGILFDVNSLKETENALQAREHELVSIIETIPAMLWSSLPTGEPTHLSKRFLEYFGAPFEEFANLGWVSVIHPDDREENVKAFFRAIETGESFSSIHRVRRADGEYRWHHVMGEPLRDPNGKILQWYGLSIDIDERKRTEDHLRDTRMKLSRASKIATVAELSASIAHELNQPLMALLGNAQAAKRWLAANPPNLTEANDSIERILRDIRSADETMLRIRALFKSELYEKKDESVLDIIQESLRFVHEDPNKREVQVNLSIEDSLPSICVDRIQIQQVFINLISNAIEATEGSSETTKILIRAFLPQEQEVVVQVIDNGIGLEDTEKIFDAFITTKEKGMGIGLAVSRSIVEAHGGRLWAQNNSDCGGSTFNVALPASSKRGVR